MSAAPSSQLPCPQCGALLTPPHRVETFTCPFCGSTLRPGEGVPVHGLSEHVLVTPEQARGAFLAWLSGAETPVGMEKRTTFEVGELHHLPFLRVRREEDEHLVPLATLPSPELAALGRVPAQMEPCESDAGEALVDQEVLAREIRAAMAEGSVHEIQIEERAYYPVRYAFGGERYGAFVDGAAGRVHPGRRPSRREVVGERAFAAGAMVLLFLLAVLVPGLPLKLVVVAVASVGLYFLLGWAVRRYG
jgi:hypothetical protein